MSKKYNNWNPEYADLVNKTFDFNGERLIVKHRIPQDNKTELYLFNLDRMSFVSGLKRIDYQTFVFCPLGKIQMYNLWIDSGTIKYNCQ